MPMSHAQRRNDKHKVRNVALEHQASGLESTPAGATTNFSNLTLCDFIFVREQCFFDS